MLPVCTPGTLTAERCWRHRGCVLPVCTPGWTVLEAPRVCAAGVHTWLDGAGVTAGECCRCAHLAGRCWRHRGCVLPVCTPGWTVLEAPRVCAAGVHTWLDGAGGTAGVCCRCAHLSGRCWRHRGCVLPVCTPGTRLDGAGGTAGECCRCAHLAHLAGRCWRHRW